MNIHFKGKHEKLGSTYLDFFQPFARRRLGTSGQRFFHIGQPRCYVLDESLHLGTLSGEILQGPLRFLGDFFGVLQLLP